MKRIKICKHNQNTVVDKIRNSNFDKVFPSESNLVDEIILKMYDMGMLNCLTDSIEDKRAHNTTVPFDLVLALAISAKMKTNTSLSDVPHAIKDHRVLAKLGYNLVSTDGDLETGLMSESSLRFLIGKYKATELFSAYNNTVQNHIMPKLDIVPNIHILDCTKLCVNFDNYNYEGAGIARDDEGDVSKGYKIGTLRGLYDDTGLIEEIVFGAMNVHDFELTKEMLLTTPNLKPGDILINDRGFLDREMLNTLKTKRGVDTYVPLKTNMIAYQTAVTAAQFENKWEPHPTRENQKIAFVQNLKEYWTDRQFEYKKYAVNDKDVDINGVVVWDTKTDNYSVFITTDMTADAKQIIMTYELRPEIEEDYRQLKDFWELEDFKSTKSHLIAFHLVMTLFGYLFFQIYTMTPEGEKFAHKCLPVILKNYQTVELPHLIFYAGDEFGILSIIDFAKLYASCDILVQEQLDYVFSLS